MRRRIGIFGATDETLRLLGLLLTNPLLELTGVWDTDPAAALVRARRTAPEVVPYLEPILTDDLDAFVGNGSFHAVIDSGEAPGFSTRYPNAADSGVQILTPLTARLLWAYVSACSALRPASIRPRNSACKAMPGGNPFGRLPSTTVVAAALRSGERPNRRGNVNGADIAAACRVVKISSIPGVEKSAMPDTSLMASEPRASCTS